MFVVRPVAESCTSYEDTAIGDADPFLELTDTTLEICCNECGSLDSWPEWCLLATFDHASRTCSIFNSYGTEVTASNFTLLNSPGLSRTLHYYFSVATLNYHRGTVGAQSLLRTRSNIVLVSDTSCHAGRC